MPSPICLIANPAAGRGTGARRLDEARRAFAAVGATDVRVTTAAGDEARLALEAAADGRRTIAVLGGDGTWSKVASALVEAGAGCRVAFLAAGTGNDFVKALGTPARDYAAMARLCADGAERVVDMGSVDGATFLNIAGFGFNCAVLEDSLRLRFPTGVALYARAALRQLFRFDAFGASLAGGVSRARSRWLGLFFANGRSFGGAFPVAPDARADDGRLDLVTIGDVSGVRRLSLLVSATRGGHVGAREVGVHRVEEVCVRFDAPPLYDADGELRRATGATVSVRCLPRALRTVAPA